MSVVIFLEARAKKDGMAALRSHIQETLRTTRGFQGCEGISAYTGTDDPDVLILIESWSSAEAHHTYVRWRRDRGDLRILYELLDSPPSVRRFEAADI